MKRNVVYESRFDNELKKIEPDFERADSLIRGIEWVLQRCPEFGTNINKDPPVWFIPAIDVFDLPYVIYYTFNSQKVFMLSFCLADEAKDR